MTTNKIEIIIPTHNELETVDELIERIDTVRTNNDLSLCLTFVDDSNDGTHSLIEEKIKEYKYIKLIRLVRQFSQASAIFAGLQESEADAVIIMDADLQDPPEAIPMLIDEYRKGSEIVLVKRESEKKNLIYILFSKVFYSIHMLLSDTYVPKNVGEFRLLSRRAYSFVNSLRESTTFLRGASMWPGYKYSIIEVNRSERYSGNTKYNFLKSLSVALDGIFSFSTKPLRLSGFLAILMLFLGIIGIIYALFIRLFTELYVPGLTLIFIAMLFFTGIQLLILGIVSEYILRISYDVKRRPKYIIDYIKKDRS